MIIPPDIEALLNSITKKRPRTVIDHIRQYGFITTEELKERYGYNHPPRAARDVREEGVPLETYNVKDSSGRSIGAYRFAPWEQFRKDQLGGRKTFSKEFKDRLIALQGSRCAVCNSNYEDRYLQVDHRVPYEVAGDSDSGDRDPSAYMLLCSSCNRAKSWSCEHCANWTSAKNPSVCLSCYWASPLAYSHIAELPERRLDVTFQREDVSVYDASRSVADLSGISLPEYVKEVLRKASEES